LAPAQGGDAELDVVSTLSTLAPAAHFIELAVPHSEDLTPHNPSIARTDEGFLCTIRSSNTKTLDGKLRIVGRHPSRSEQYLALLDNDLRLKEVELLVDETDPAPKVKSRHRGFVDLRIFQLRDEWKAIAATVEYSDRGVSQMALLDLNVTRNRLSNALLLSTPMAGNQKNWMPVVGMDRAVLVTHCHPTRVISIDLVAGATLPIASHSSPRWMKNFRGGSQLVPFAKGYLTIIHEVIPRSGGGQCYLHRVVHFDEEFAIDAVSPQFVFQIQDVEFAAGMAHWDGHCIIGFGENDCRALLAVVPDDQLMSLLDPVA
jgi:hypothetical protein